jgi:hypothetical protein
MHLILLRRHSRQAACLTGVVSDLLCVSFELILRWHGSPGRFAAPGQLPGHQRIGVRRKRRKHQSMK